MVGKVTVTSVSAIDYAEWLVTIQRLYAGNRTWCQGAPARNANGNDTPSHSPYAVCWCLYGAALRATGEQGGWLATPEQEPMGSSSKWRADTLLDFMAEQLPATFRPDLKNRAAYLVILWNDAPGRTEAEVKAFVGKCWKEADSAARLLKEARSR